MALVFEAAKEAESHGGYEKHGPDKSPSQGREGTQDGSLGCWLYMFLDLYVCMYANSLQCGVQDFATLWTIAHHGILQPRILEWVAMPSRGIFRPRDQTVISCVSGEFFTFSTTWEVLT